MSRSRVSDNGVGIDGAQKECLFEEFEQLASPDGASGSGLGLALTKGFCAALGDDLSVVCEAGQSSTFTVRLPFHRPGAEAEQGDAGQQPAAPRGWVTPDVG